MVHVEIDGHKYIREGNDSQGEVLTVSQVRPMYVAPLHRRGVVAPDTEAWAWLELAFTEMPKTRFRPGMRIRVIIEK